MATPAPEMNLTGTEAPQPRKRARTPSPVAESSARDRLERPDLFPDPPPRTPTADSSFESSEEEQPLTPPADWTSAWDPRDSDGEGELQYVPQYDSDGDEARWQAREEREFSEERRAMSAERRTPVVYSPVSSVYSSYMPVSNPLPSPPRHSSSLPLFLAGFHSGSGDSSEESDAASETSNDEEISAKPQVLPAKPQAGTETEETSDSSRPSIELPVEVQTRSSSTQAPEVTQVVVLDSDGEEEKPSDTGARYSPIADQAERLHLNQAKGPNGHLPGCLLHGSACPRRHGLHHPYIQRNHRRF